MAAKTFRTDPPADPQPSGSDMAALPLAVGSVAVRVWMELGTEAVRFVWDRLQQNMKTQQAMLGCRSLEELRMVQTEFFSTAQQQYADEAAKMLDLLGSTAAGGLPVSGLKRRYDDIPL